MDQRFNAGFRVRNGASPVTDERIVLALQASIVSWNYGSRLLRRQPGPGLDGESRPTPTRPCDGDDLEMIIKNQINLRAGCERFCSPLLNTAWPTTTAATTPRSAGGGQSSISIDLEEAEKRFVAELTEKETPESAFELRWAVALLDAAMSRLEQEYVAAQKQQHFEVLRPFLTAAQARTQGYDELAMTLRISKVAARQAVHRMRERFRDILRNCVADTLREPTPAEVDEELAAVKMALSRSPV